MARPPGARVDHYELVEHLADGAQAEVHRGRDLHSGQDVVVKFPHARVLDNPVLRARWRRESGITARLSHPNIQCRLDAADHHSEPFVVLEYATGGSLDRHVSVADPLPVPQVVGWGRQLAEALAYIHTRGVIHRDLKPANVLLTGDLDVKLADFGSALERRDRKGLFRLPSPPEGTPEYLSPEQITGEGGDERSDIYGWGVVMYELLTGQVPFTGPDPMAAMEAHLTETATPLGALRADIPQALEAVVLTALRRDPAHRYPTATALLGDLGRLDQLDLASFDLRPEPPTRGVVGGAQGRAMARLAGVIAGSFLLLVAIVISLAIALR